MIETIKMVTINEFNKMFSFPNDPGKHLAPGEHLDMLHIGTAPSSHIRALITDIYIENLGSGESIFSISESSFDSGLSYQVRYKFHTVSNQVLSINFTTGLKLGDNDGHLSRIRIENEHGSAHIHPRINGIIVYTE